MPATVIALRVTYNAQELLSSEPTSAAAVAQGQRVALAVALCMAAAAAGRSLLVFVDGLVTRRPPRRLPVPLSAAVAVASLAAMAVALVSVGAPDFVQRQYDVFVNRNAVRDTGDVRDRLIDPASNGRIALWKVGARSFEAEPLLGHGAGTYQLLWNRDRPFVDQAFDAHSLYVETLAELGWPGLAALGIALLTLLGRHSRAHPRPRPGAVRRHLRRGVGLGAESRGDWDWEMPVVTLWLFALGGATLATPRRARANASESGPALRARCAWWPRWAAWCWRSRRSG